MFRCKGNGILTSVRATNLSQPRVIAVGQVDASDITRTAGSLTGSRSWYWGAETDLAFEEAVHGHEGGCFTHEKIASCGDEGAADEEREDREMHGGYTDSLGLVIGLIDGYTISQKERKVERETETRSLV